MSTADEIYTHHQAIGFPTLSEQDQLQLLFQENVEIINKLTPGFEANFVPYKVLKAYVTISKERFKNFFLSSNYYESLNRAHKENPSQDGQWLEQSENDSFIFYVQERGQIVQTIKFKSNEEMHDFFVDQFFRKIS